MIYFISSGLLVIAFMLLQKKEEKQNFWCALAMTIMTYECYLCLTAGILSLFHINVDIYSVSIINFLAIAGIVFFLWKKRKFQAYKFDLADTFFVLFLVVLVVLVFINRFTTDLLMIFCTCDPANHLQMAMDVVNKKTVSGMYFGGLINGLFIESMWKFFPDILTYKSFLIQYGFNFFMAGFVFWAVVRKLADNIAIRILGYFMTFIYLMAYPYNELLYGFVYLQMTITVICYLIALLQDYLEEPTNIWWELWIGAGCLTVSVGYSLFAPPVYLSVFAFVLYKAYREKWLLASNGRRFFSLRIILSELKIFLIPVLLTLWFEIIAPSLVGSATDYGTAIIAEGAIYRNLYSDFLLYALAAVCGIAYSIREKKINLLSVLGPVFVLYDIFFFYRMLTGQCSTYYYYKLNYLLWMMILVAFAMGMAFFWERERIVFSAVAVGVTIFMFLYSYDIEYTLQGQNESYIGFEETSTFFHINDINSYFRYSYYQTPDDIIDISSVVREMEQESVVFIGDFYDRFWYEALSNQRFAYNIRDYEHSELFEMYLAGDYGDYAVVEKDLENMDSYQEWLESHAIYEDDLAYIVKK
jgi:hypothetical protein